MCTLIYISLVFLFGAYSSVAGEFGTSSEAPPSSPPDGNVTFKETVIPTKKMPMELGDIIVVPIDYDKDNYNESFPDPLIGLEIRVENIAFLEDSQKCNISMWVVVGWTDSRLRLASNYSNIITDWIQPVPLTALQYVWQPDTRLEYKGSRYDTLSGKMSSYDETSRLFWRRWNRTECVGCIRFNRETMRTFQSHIELDYKFFPNDKHISTFWLTPGYYSKGNASANFFPVRHPLVEIDKDSFTLDLAFDTRVASTGITATAPQHNNDSVAAGRFDFVVIFERRLESYIYKIYIPSGLFVMLSWLSMLLPAGIAAERVALCATTLLTVNVFYNTAGQSGAAVSYLRALDIWLLGCIAFVFLILFQNVIILRIAARKFKKRKLRDVSSTGDIKQALHSLSILMFEQMQEKFTGADPAPKSVPPITITPTIHNNDLESKAKSSPLELDKTKDDEPPLRSAKIATIIDRLSLIAFAVILAVCNGFYWNWLLNSVQKTCYHDEQCMERLIDTDAFRRAQWKRYSYSSP